MYFTCFNNYLLTQYIPAVPCSPYQTHTTLLKISERSYPFFSFLDTLRHIFNFVLRPKAGIPARDA